MGFRLQRRISLGKGSFMNLSGSGLSLAQRTKWGSYGTRGYSIRTGIRGFYYRKSYGKKGDAVGTLLVVLILSATWVVMLVAVQVVLVIVRVVIVCVAYAIAALWWCVLTSWDFSKYCVEQWRARSAGRGSTRREA